MSDKYGDAAEWAEHDMELPENSPSALRGQAAADFGRDLIERRDPHASGRALAGRRGSQRSST
jgi:hypothetical protein